MLRKEEEFIERNDAVKNIRGLGNDQKAKSIWGKLVGYKRRLIIESMVSRWKRLYGGELKSRCSESKQSEVQLKAMMIQGMIDAQAT